MSDRYPHLVTNGFPLIGMTQAIPHFQNLLTVYISLFSWKYKPVFTKPLRCFILEQISNWGAIAHRTLEQLLKLARGSV